MVQNDSEQAKQTLGIAEEQQKALNTKHEVCVCVAAFRTIRMGELIATLYVDCINYITYLY